LRGFLKKLVSIIVPVYNEENNINIFIDVLKENLNFQNYNFELIFCLDPSSDFTENEIVKACDKLNYVKLIKFSRKIGQAKSIFAGLKESRGNCAIIMDVDLQDPPSLIPKLLEKWDEGFLHVKAERISREGEPLIKDIVSRLGYWFLNKFSETNIPKNTGDFRLIDKKIIELLNNFKESNFFLRGLMSHIGFETATVKFIRPPRKFGKTKYNKYLGSLKIAFDGIIGFSTVLLKLSIFAGFIVSIIGLSFAAYFIYLKLNNVNTQSGITSIVILISLVGGFNLFATGILGLYVGRMSDDVKERPKYYISRMIGFDN
jgi:dolichol-phosphate mannosyltransferase